MSALDLTADEVNHLTLALEAYRDNAEDDQVAGGDQAETIKVSNALLAKLAAIEAGE